jgi:hypothetical protein
MPYTRVGYSDHTYLHKITEFMTACRQEDPLVRMWDVGDLQWWWHNDEYADPTKQVFWANQQGMIGWFVLLSQAYRSLGYDMRHQRCIEPSDSALPPSCLRTGSESTWWPKEHHTAPWDR